MLQLHTVSATIATLPLLYICHRPQDAQLSSKITHMRSIMVHFLDWAQLGSWGYKAHHCNWMYSRCKIQKSGIRLKHPRTILAEPGWPATQE